MGHDWLVGLDDMMTERLKICLLCGHVAQWMDIRSVGHQGVCASLCQRCYDHHGWPAVDALLAQRYPP